MFLGTSTVWLTMQLKSRSASCMGCGNGESVEFAANSGHRQRFLPLKGEE